jgi:hypothetical protein
MEASVDGSGTRTVTNVQIPYCTAPSTKKKEYKNSRNENVNATLGLQSSVDQCRSGSGSRVLVTKK